MGFIKKQLLKVIEWKDESHDTIVYRLDVNDRYAIMKGSRLIVRESQEAIFVYRGQVADVFGPGDYRLDTDNLPVLTAICNWKYAFENPFVGEVYFVNTQQFTDQKWGTANPIMMRDADFGVIRLRGYGVYTFRVKDSKKMMKELTSTVKEFKTTSVTEQLRKMIISKVTDTIASSKIPALDLAMSYNELSEQVQVDLAADFDAFGLELASFYIENLSLPPEVEKMLDERTNMGVIGDKMGTYTQFQAAQAMRDAAKNTSGGLAGAGVGLGAGLGIGNMFTAAIGGAKDTAPAAAGAAVGAAAVAGATVKCSVCGKDMPAAAKFCPECGAKAAAKKFCPDCGKEVTDATKFCPDCGKKLK